MKLTNVVKYPLSTEKSLKLLDSNAMVFVVDLKATKKEVKKAIEALYNVKVDSVNVLVDPKGKKKAYIKFNESSLAIDVATKLGIM
ncbi:MAG: 50S ribosomal protein L23 [Nitrospiraceae bacterium]|nr:50S ribosomal protein L23 [Nitrospiraceae bacterium]